MLGIRRLAAFAVAASFGALALAVALSGEAVAQSCTTTGYTYNSACSGNANAAGTTVSASATTIAAAAATQGLVSNRISSFRASSGAPGGRAANPHARQVFAFGTSGKTASAAKVSEIADRQKALEAANSRYDTPVEAQVRAEREANKDELEELRLRLGMSAGENSDNRFGVWGNGAFFRLEGSKSNAKIESDVLSGMVGLDYKVSPRMLVGISAGYENTDTDTKFNSGTVEGSGFVVAPYMSIGLTDRVSLDAIVGYGLLEYDTTRRDPLSNALITGSTDADRLFGSVDLVAGHRMDKWLLEGRLGASHINETQDAYRESNANAVAENDITVTSGNLGARIGYAFTTVEPYLAGLYSYDFNRAEGTYDGRNTYGGSAGINFWLTPRFTINLEGKASQKEDLTSYGGSATLRLDF